MQRQASLVPELYSNTPFHERCGARCFVWPPFDPIRVCEGGKGQVSTSAKTPTSAVSPPALPLAPRPWRAPPFVIVPWAPFELRLIFYTAPWIHSCGYFASWSYRSRGGGLRSPLVVLPRFVGWGRWVGSWWALLAWQWMDHAAFSVVLVGSRLGGVVRRADAVGAATSCGAAALVTRRAVLCRGRFAITVEWYSSDTHGLACDRLSKGLY